MFLPGGLCSASHGSCLANDPTSNPRPEVLPLVVRCLHSELNISPGELMYGLGEQFGALVKNGNNQPDPMSLISDAFTNRSMHQSMESRWGNIQ